MEERTRWRGEIRLQNPESENPRGEEKGRSEKKKKGERS